MEESTRHKPRLVSGIFRPSFASCSSRALSDVAEKSVLVPHRHSFHPFPSMCKPISPIEPASRSGPIQIPKVTEDSTKATFTLGDVLKGRICPTAAPIVSPLNYPFHKLDNKKKHKCEPSLEDQWFSSDDEREEEDETDTLFSSISFSSDSSGSHRQRCSARQRRRRNRPQVGVLPMNSDDKNNIKGSFAVVKKSSDPHGDFRTSMVEMIIEKQMFGAQDLERLLQCFLSLNSHHHHKVIVEVFTEIWEALFPHWS